MSQLSQFTAPMLQPCRLAATLDGINKSGITGKEKWALQKHAINVFMADTKPATPPCSTPDSFDKLDETYGILSEAAGTRISRPTAAVAFVRTMGIVGFEKRISKLTSRRNHAAHPDNGLNSDLRDALANIDTSFRHSRAAAFRDKRPSEKVTAATASSGDDTTSGGNTTDDCYERVDTNESNRDKWSERMDEKLEEIKQMVERNSAAWTTDHRELSDEEKDMVTLLKYDALKSMHAAGWYGIFRTFEPIHVKTQVVAGTNYFVKVKIADENHIHMRISKPLPHTQEPPFLAACKECNDDVAHF